MPQEHPDQKDSSNRHLLLKYTGLAVQWFVILFLSVFIGKKTDSWLKVEKPIFIWIIPVLGLIGLLIGVIRDTRPPQKK